MADTMVTKETNVTTVREEDRTFIRSLMSLSPEKKILVKGILIGMDLQEKPATVRPDSHGPDVENTAQESDCNRLLILGISAH